jgi:hypothetical protein
LRARNTSGTIIMPPAHVPHAAQASASLGSSRNWARPNVASGPKQQGTVVATEKILELSLIVSFSLTKLESEN